MQDVLNYQSLINSLQQKEKTARLSEARPPKFTALARPQHCQHSTLLRVWFELKAKDGARGRNSISKTMKMGVTNI